MINPLDAISLRLRPLAWLSRVALLLSFLLTPTHSLLAQSWNTGDGQWTTASNWTPNGVPNGTDIRIGDLPGVQNSTVFLGPPGAGYNSLEISDGMTLDTDGGELVSFGPALVTGLNSRLIVRTALGPNMHDFQGILTVGVGAHLELHENVLLKLFGASQSSGTLSGWGQIFLNTATPFRNGGIIDPDNNGGIVMTQGPLGDLPIDLDGTSGTGQLLLNTSFSELEIIAGSLTDTFSGNISMGTGALLTMNIADGWTADASSSINIGGLDNPAAASQIAGSSMTIGGMVNVGGAQGRLRILAPATFLPSATVGVGITDGLELDGTTVVEGGQFTLGQGAQLNFDSSTTVQGGTFATFSNLSSDGSVNFKGATHWDGNATINGLARQIGEATVVSPSTISAQVLDMDGSGATTWEVNNQLIVNAGHINTSLSNTFAGTLNVGSGFLPRITIHLEDPLAVWTMAGEMSLSGVPAAVFSTSRLFGSPVRVTGGVHLNRLAGIAADATFTNSSSLSFDNPATVLTMHGTTQVESGAEFIGAGTLRNNSTGHLTLASGLTLDQVGLVNDGLLEIGNSPGVATVDRFENGDTGVWQVELGGYLAGTEFDLLLVGGASALLDGIIEVALIDTGGGLFLPEIGDEFRILKAVGGVSGEFLNSPVSMAAGKTFHWSVEYNPGDVTLILTDIVVPEPATGVLLSLCAIPWAAGRRRRAAAR